MQLRAWGYSCQTPSQPFPECSLLTTVIRVDFFAAFLFKSSMMKATWMAMRLVGPGDYGEADAFLKNATLYRECETRLRECSDMLALSEREMWGKRTLTRSSATSMTAPQLQRGRWPIHSC